VVKEGVVTIGRVIGGAGRDLEKVLKSEAKIERKETKKVYHTLLIFSTGGSDWTKAEKTASTM
jgi:hypothetical protein